MSLSNCITTCGFANKERRHAAAHYRGFLIATEKRRSMNWLAHRFWDDLYGDRCSRLPAKTEPFREGLSWSLTEHRTFVFANGQRRRPGAAGAEALCCVGRRKRS